MPDEEQHTALMTRHIPVEPVFYERPRTPPSVAETAAPPAPPTTSMTELERSSPRRWAIFGIALLVIVAMILAFTTRDSGRHTSTSTSGASSEPGAPAPSDNAAAQPSAGARPAGTPQASPTTSARTETTLGPNRTVLLEIKRDQGSKATQHFVVPGSRWTLGWAYDCSQQGGTGSFKVTILNADGTPSNDGGVDQQGAKGSSVAAYTSSGERYVSVQTACLWAIRVTT